MKPCGTPAEIDTLSDIAQIKQPVDACREGSRTAKVLDDPVYHYNVSYCDAQCPACVIHLLKHLSLTHLECSLHEALQNR